MCTHLATPKISRYLLYIDIQPKFNGDVTFRQYRPTLQQTHAFNRVVSSVAQSLNKPQRATRQSDGSANFLCQKPTPASFMTPAKFTQKTQSATVVWAHERAGRHAFCARVLHVQSQTRAGW